MTDPIRIEMERQEEEVRRATDGMLRALTIGGASNILFAVLVLLWLPDGAFWARWVVYTSAITAAFIAMKGHGDTVIGPNIDELESLPPSDLEPNLYACAYVRLSREKVHNGVVWWMLRLQQFVTLAHFFAIFFIAWK
jgi:hypothetical protein